MSKILLIFVVFFYKLALSEIKVNSIIKLNNNIPEECGLNFFLENDNSFTNASVSIKKLENNETITVFKVNGKNTIQNADLSTSSLKISEIIEKKKRTDKGIEIKGKTKQDSMTFFFQEILIGGGSLNVDDVLYEINGPIDSKVRLEYLFCTGEMFLPNYESNRDE